MTREELIRIATEIWGNPNWNELQVSRLERLANFAAAHEREACAMVADEWTHAYPHPSKVIAESIRARGQA
jgi:hypothetical protein